MHRLGYCFRCRWCSCIASKKEELEPRRREITFKNSTQIKNTLTKTCPKMANEDIHSNKSFIASSSSRRSTPSVEEHPTLEDIQAAYKKLQSLRAESPLMNFYAPSSIGIQYSSNEILENERIENQLQVAPCNIFVSSKHPCSKQNKHFISNNTTNYRGPLSTGSTTPTFSNPPEIPSIVSLQEFIKKKNINKSSTIPKEHAKECPKECLKECPIDDLSTGRLMNKLRNLDEILQNLDHSLLYRKFSNNLIAPLVDDNYLASNPKLSDRINPILKTNAPKEIKYDARVFPSHVKSPLDTHPCSITTKSKLRLSQMPDTTTLSILNSKSPTTFKVDSDRDIDNSCTESGSSEATHVCQSFSTPIANKATDDIPLLLSNCANFKNQSPVASYIEENAIKELVGLVEKHILQRMQYSRGTRQQRQVNSIISYL